MIYFVILDYGDIKIIIKKGDENGDITFGDTVYATKLVLSPKSQAMKIGPLVTKFFVTKN